MICKKCGAALPANGMLCRACGNAMAPDQIESIRKMNSAQKEGVRMVTPQLVEQNDNLKNYKTQKDNRYLGTVVVLGIFLIVLIIAVVLFFTNA